MANLTQTTQESLDLVKGQVSEQISLGKDNQGLNDLQKSITTALGLVGYNLEAPAKQLVVFKAPILKTIPRKIETTGKIVNWKVITAVNTAQSLGAIEGARGGGITTTKSDKNVTMKSISLQGSVTLEAQAAGRNFQDAKATEHTNLLLRLMTEEEKLILFGNGTAALSSAPTPTVSATTTGGAIGSGTYKVSIVAMTGIAANRVTLNTQQAALVLGVQAYSSDLSAGAMQAISGAFDGVTAPGTAGSAAVTSSATGQLYATWTGTVGAMAYGVFVGTSGAETLQIVTTNTNVTLTSLVTSGTTLASCTADGSLDPNVYDGVVAQVVAGGGYYKDLAGAKLTQAKAGVAEIDTYCAWLFNTWKIGPSKGWMGYQFFKDVTDAVVGTTGAPVYYEASNAQSRASLVLGVRVASYLNKYTGEAFSIEVHPWMPPSTAIFFVDVVPFENANIPNVLEFGLGFDYMAIEYAMTKPVYEFETRYMGALKHYFPAAFGIITNVAAGLQ